jgi:hypothetical protein
LKRISIILILLLASAAARSQNQLDAFLIVTDRPVSAKDKAKDQLQSFIQHLPNKTTSDEKLLRKIFCRTHRIFLKHYVAYSDFENVFTSGQYDCLTATALFSEVLSELNFSYDIIETNYHIFLIVHTEQGDVLIETTDRYEGFVKGEEQIAKREEAYRKNDLSAEHSKKFQYHYSFNLYQKITGEKLAGLLYFNQAVKAFNQHNWLLSARMLEKAQELYPSPRCEELGTILILTVMESPLEEKIKDGCLAHLKNLWTKKSRTVAAN